MAYVFLISLILIGFLLKFNIKFFQYIYLPSAIIGGFIGFILGPGLLREYALINIPSGWLDHYSLLPGVLLIPIFAAIPFSLINREKTDFSKSKPRDAKRNIIYFTLILVIVTQFQGFLGLISQMFLSWYMNDLVFYPTFGLEFVSGFTGGHGTAGLIGSILKSFNDPYWKTSQDIVITTATIGLIVSLIIGIIIVNYAARKGYLKQSFKIHKENKVKRPQLNINRKKIIVFFIQLIIIGGGSILSYLIYNFIVTHKIILLSNVPIWLYTLILMFFVSKIMIYLKLNKYVDYKVMSKITKILMDFAIVAAITSLSLRLIIDYLLPVLVVSFLIISLTVLLVYLLNKYLFTTLVYERIVIILGTSLGVFITGLIFLRMVDSEYETSLLSEYTVSYSLNSMITFIFLPIMITLLATVSLFAGIIFNLILLTVAIIILIIYKII